MVCRLEKIFFFICRSAEGSSTRQCAATSFILHIAISFSRIIQQHGVRFKLFAENTQFSISIPDIGGTVKIIRYVIYSVRDWVYSKQLKLNDDRNDFMLVEKASFSH